MEEGCQEGGQDYAGKQDPASAALMNRLIHGDCINELRQLADKSVDLVITDPPYGLNKRMKGGTWGLNSIYREMLKWDHCISQDYFDEMARIAKNQIIWGGNHYKMPPSRCWLAWIKTERMRTMADFELAWTSFDKVSKSFTERRNPDGKRVHPTQKPLSLMRWCVEAFSNPGDLILDPFAGSGTTCVAAKQLGRHYIGIEREAEYIAIAKVRLGFVGRATLKAV